MIVDEAPIFQPITFGSDVTAIWQKWFSSVGDALGGEHYSGEFGLTTDYEPSEANIVLAGGLCVINFVWDNNYPDSTSFEVELPREGSKALSFVESIILLYANTENGNEVKFATVNGTTITMPSITGANKVIASSTLILDRSL